MRQFIACLLLILIVPAAHAEPVPLSAGEIKALLSGNTCIGTWRGDPYKQYFAADGSTIYAP